MRAGGTSVRERPSRGFTLVVAAGLVAAWLSGALLAAAASKTLADAWDGYSDPSNGSTEP